VLVRKTSEKDARREDGLAATKATVDWHQLDCFGIASSSTEYLAQAGAGATSYSSGLKCSMILDIVVFQQGHPIVVIQQCHSQ
jgi:hypothetical protein